MIEFAAKQADYSREEGGRCLSRCHLSLCELFAEFSGIVGSFTSHSRSDISPAGDDGEIATTPTRLSPVYGISRSNALPISKLHLEGLKPSNEKPRERGSIC